jgi:hypothetical protein
MYAVVRLNTFEPNKLAGSADSLRLDPLRPLLICSLPGRGQAALQNDPAACKAEPAEV